MKVGKKIQYFEKIKGKFRTAKQNSKLRRLVLERVELAVARNLLPPVAARLARLHGGLELLAGPGLLLALDLDDVA